MAVFVLLITLIAYVGLRKAKVDCPKKVLCLVLFMEVVGVVISVRGMITGDASLLSLKRPDPGKRRITREVELRVSDGKWKKAQIRVSAREPTEAEAKEALDQAEKQIRKEYLGKNNDPQRVYRNLKLRNVYQGVVKAGWRSTPGRLLDDSGQLRREAVKEPVNVTVLGLLRCKDQEREISLPIKVIPMPFQSPGALTFYLQQALKQADREDEQEEAMRLPQSAAGRSIRYREKRKDDGPTVCLLGLAALFLAVFMEHRKKKQERQRFQASLNQDYPMVLSQLGLYVGAGFSVPAAFAEVGKMYGTRLARGHPKGEGYEAVLTLSRKLKDGCSEQEGYLWLGETLENRNFRKLSLLLLSNMKKGDSELRSQLEQEENAAFEERKIRAKVAGEEASTKLLLPMVGLLGVVLLVLLVPAVSQLGI